MTRTELLRRLSDPQYRAARAQGYDDRINRFDRRRQNAIRYRKAKQGEARRISGGR
jgi:hypothetical protein